MFVHVSSLIQWALIREITVYLSICIVLPGINKCNCSDVTIANAVLVRKNHLDYFTVPVRALYVHCMTKLVARAVHSM